MSEPAGVVDPVQRRIVSVLVLVQVVGGIGNGAGLAVGALLIKDITGSSGWSGMAVVMLTLGAAAFTVPLSSIAARHGRRPALTLGWMAGALGAFVTVIGAEAESLPLTLLGLVLFGRQHRRQPPITVRRRRPCRTRTDRPIPVDRRVVDHDRCRDRSQSHRTRCLLRPDDQHPRPGRPHGLLGCRLRHRRTVDPRTAAT
ncbi:hypothetical protein [Aeromicrobium sp. UC242_57]|uniref:hypothetical protein n=1 Tax=Aeromicrobium sp. UC242_57 TaxID=3374624 RepID=UPI00378909F3